MADTFDLDALAALVSDTRGDSRLIAQVLSAVPALIAAARPATVPESWNPNTAGPDCDWCGSCSWCAALRLQEERDQALAQRDAARAEVAALRERLEAARDACRAEDARLRERVARTQNKESQALLGRERIGWSGAAGALDDLLRAALTTGGDQ